MWLSEWDVRRALGEFLSASDSAEARTAIEHFTPVQKAGFVTLLAQGESWRICADLMRSCPDSAVVRHAAVYAQAIAAGFIKCAG